MRFSLYLVFWTVLLNLTDYIFPQHYEKFLDYFSEWTLGTTYEIWLLSLAECLVEFEPAICDPNLILIHWATLSKNRTHLHLKTFLVTRWPWTSCFLLLRGSMVVLTILAIMLEDSFLKHHRKQSPFWIKSK